VALDSTGTLDDRLITLVGFTLHDGDVTDLARIAIFCCAADAQLARIHLEGPAAPSGACGFRSRDPSGRRLLARHRGYQLALRMPGSSPRCAISRTRTRDRPNFRR
jgi:hypothetical protein